MKIILQAQDFDLLKEALCSTKMNIWPILSAKKLQQVGQKCTINSFVQAIEACENGSKFEAVAVFCRYIQGYLFGMS